MQKRLPRSPFNQFEKIYWVKRKEVKAFFDAHGGSLDLARDGQLYHASELLASVKGRLGPARAEDDVKWKRAGW